ncbi:MAG: hypothetical protein ACHP9Z_12125 [Streptosporangiales bacterium]
MAALIVMFLTGTPVAALAAAGWAGAGSLRAERAQARWHRVPAVLLQNAPEPAHAMFQASLDPLARARWTAPGGAPRAGDVYAPGGARAGTIVMVWTDGSGRLAGVPLQRADMAAREALAGLLAAALVAAALAAAGALACRALDRQRLAAWDADWSETGPQWTGQR